MQRDLLEVCKVGDLDKIRGILSSHPELINEELDENGWTALITSAYYNHPEVIAFLFTFELLDVNKRDLEEHRSALHYAAGDGHKAIVELLIKHPQIDPNSNDQLGNTPLHNASSNGEVDIISMLLSHPSISAGIANNDGKTAVDVCCHGPKARRSKKDKIIEMIQRAM